MHIYTIHTCIFIMFALFCILTYFIKYSAINPKTIKTTTLYAYKHTSK
jgi:hypothetical protein